MTAVQSSTAASSKAWFTPTPRAYVTPALVGVNVAVFVLMALSGVGLLSPRPLDLIRWGANFGPLTTHGEWWRLLTATFVHIGALHLLCNMWALWDVGVLMERLVGPAGLLVLYLLAGLAGSVASLSWHLFEQQEQSYRDEVLPPHITARVAVEQGSVIGWDRYAGSSGAIIGMHTFGSSAPLSDLLKKFGFTPEKVYEAAKDQIARAKSSEHKPTPRTNA